MFKNIPQQGKFRPQEKQELSTGMVIICTNIEEHTPEGDTTGQFTYYTWIESRYTADEYKIKILEDEKAQMKSQLDNAVQESKNLAQYVSDLEINLMMNGVI